MKRRKHRFIPLSPTARRDARKIEAIYRGRTAGRAVEIAAGGEV